MRYFVIWPPPHPGKKRREDRASYYWSAKHRVWEKDRYSATAYKTREEADAEAFIAATTMTDGQVGLGQVGVVRTSRQLLRV